MSISRYFNRWNSINIFFVVFVSIFVHFAGSQEQECGLINGNARTTTLLGDGKARDDDSPWHVAIFHEKTLTCGGTIVHELLVISAAHCFTDGTKDVNVEDYEVILAKYINQYGTPDNSIRKTFKIREIRFSNSGYNGAVNYYQGDIAILILTDKITMSSAVLPACIDWQQSKHSKRPSEGELGKVVEWSQTESKGSNSRLKAIYLPFIETRRCKTKVNEDFLPYITLDKFCAGTGNRTGPSLSDEGGGAGAGILFVENGRYYLRGVASIKQLRLDAVNLFTDLSWYIDIIAKIREEVGKRPIKIATPTNTNQQNETDPMSISTNAVNDSNSKTNPVVGQQFPADTAGTEKKKPSTFGLSCTTSLTLKNGQQVCAAEEIFSESFDKLDTSVWSYTVKFPNAPDFEFVTYNKSDNVVYVKQSKLFIKPEIQPDTYFTLKDCTGEPNTIECTRDLPSHNISPPVLSGQITTKKSFSFRYGKITIRAKLPFGDWIVPEISLRPAENNYGDYYESGQIRIAMSRGNEEYYCNHSYYDHRRLEAGIKLGSKYNSERKFFDIMNANSWTNDFHNYTVTWTPDKILFQVDSKNIGLLLPESHQIIRQLFGSSHDTESRNGANNKLAPSNKEFYITLGVSVGGVSDFPDNCETTRKKPWKNASPMAMQNFWKEMDKWKNTWVNEKSALEVDYVKVWSL